MTLNPALSPALIDRQVYINIFEPLLKLSPNMKIQPNLVTRWKIANGTGAGLITGHRLADGDYGGLSS